MLQISEPRREILIFDNPAEAARLAGEATYGGMHGRWVPNFEAQDHKFRGRKFRDWSEVAAAAVSPWDEGLEAVRSMQDQIEKARLPRPLSKRRRGTWSEDDGDDFDLARFRSGQAYWRASQRRRGLGFNTVTIVSDVSANRDVSPTDILWRGAASMCLAKILEQAGYRTEIWAAWGAQCYYYSGRELFSAVRLKRPHDRLDTGRVAAGVSGWFFRTVFFAAGNLAGDRPTRHLGFAVPVAHLVHHVTPDPARILVSGAWSFCEAVELVRRELETLCGEANLVDR